MSPTEITPLPAAPAVASNPVSTRPATTTTSTIRRKPKITYQSPSAYYNPPSLRIEASAHAFFHAVASKVGSTSSPPDPSLAKVKSKRKFKKVKDGGVEKKPTVTPIPRYSMGPPLPLYHPLGRLALSLPELDPATLGLPPLPTDDGSRRSSARTRRPAAKLREADEESSSTPAASASISNETKEKASPKKKGGARPGAGMKRKRKDADEDATYPAKKTRNPRGSALARVTTSEAPSLPEVAPPAIPDSMVETPQEEKRPERRSTRSRGSLLRRDSSGSGSEVTATSASAVGKAKSTETVGLKTPTTEDGKPGSGNADGEGKGNGKDELAAEDAKH